MATRRPAPPAWISASLFVGLAALPLPASAQYMALTAPPPDVRPVVAPETPKSDAAKSDAAKSDAAKSLPPSARKVEHALNGSLPNQRTGTGRQRVVRDICIGCDR